MEKTETYLRDQLRGAAIRFDDLADIIATDKQYDPVPFLKASGKRYKFASENGDGNNAWYGVAPIPMVRRTPMDSLHRIVSGAPITPRELRCAGVFCLLWFALDAFWFVSTLNHWWGL